MGESQPLKQLLPDQSFRTYTTSDRTRLEKVESAISTYANGLMQRLGKYQPLSLNNTGAGSNTSGFFPHGIVDAKNTTFVAMGGTGPGKANEIAPSLPTMITDGETITIVETSEELILTQQTTLALVGRTFSVPGSTHLLVFGNVVYIHGKISAPGKHIVIVAHEICTVAAGQEQAEINVDGAPPLAAPLPKSQAQIIGDGSGTPAGWYREIFQQEHPIWAGMGKQGTDGEDGRSGETGKPAGEIYLLCDALPDSSALTLSVKGGAGQDGQPGQKGSNGGPGGTGYLHRYNEWYDKHDYYKYLPPGDGGAGGLGGRGGLGGPGGNSGNCIVVVNKAVDGNVTSKGPITLFALPGALGCRGLRGENGSTGSRGADQPLPPGTIRGRPNPRLKFLEPPFGRGYLANEPKPDLPDPPSAKWGRYLLVHSVYATSSSETKSPPYKDLRGIAQVSYLHMLLETARLRYLQWDAYRFAQDAEADDKKDELVALLDFLGLGLRLLPTFVAESDINVLDGIRNTALSLIKHLAAELDYFGQTPDYVPLGSPNMYFTPLTETLTLLKTREDIYTTYAQALKETKVSHEQRATTIDYAKKGIEALEQNTNLLSATLLDYVKKKIPAEDMKVAKATDVLKPKLENLKTWVTTCFGLTPEDFIDCVFNLAFIGSPLQAGSGGKDVISGHGAFTALTTISSQSAKLITKGVNTLPNDEGQPVNRKHLLHKVDAFSKKLSNLSEVYHTIKDARHPNDPELVQLDDPDAYRLVVGQEEFDNLLDQFSTKPEAQAAMAAMDNYVKAVQARNAVLENYNTLVTEYLRVAGDISTTKGQISAIEQLMVNNAQPNLPAETAFVTALYNRTRERCIEQFYLASRAYRFWSLEPETALYSTLKLGSPNEINHTLLSAAAEELFNNRTNRIKSKLDESKKKDNKAKLEWFPSEEDGDNTINRTGISVVLQPKNVYSVRFLSAAGCAQLPSQGQGLVIIALIDLKLHIRIFDTDKKQVVDKAEDELLSGEYLTALKRYFDITRVDVLRTAYGWTREHMNTLSAVAQRQAVIDKLYQLSADKPGSFEESNDYYLTGRCAIQTFLRGTGVRNDAGLKGMVVENHRNTLIVENGGRLGKTGPELWAMDHQMLVQLGLEWAKTDFLRSRLTELSAEEQEAILDAVATITQFPLARGYPKEFAELKKTGVASFTIPAPSVDSIKKEHPFAAFYNTRITKVRAWVRGVKTGDDMCHMLLQPQGNEVICAEDFTPFSFRHDPIHAFSFVYEYTKVKWNEQGQYVENPGEALKHASMSGTLTCVGDYTNSAYVPLIGPFTEWKIILSEGKYNTGLDRSQIEAIHLEFQGFQQTYEGGVGVN